MVQHLAPKEAPKDGEQGLTAGQKVVVNGGLSLVARLGIPQTNIVIAIRADQNTIISMEDLSRLVRVEGDGTIPTFDYYGAYITYHGGRGDFDFLAGGYNELNDQLRRHGM